TKVGHAQVAQKQAAIGMGVGAHAALAPGREFGELWPEAALLVEEIGRSVASHPVVEDANVLGVLVHFPHRHLMGAPGILGAPAIYFFGARPAFRAAEDDHRPARTLSGAIPGLFLDAPDFADDG